MLNLRLDVVRADDLLVLSFEFVNLDFDVDETPVLPRLVRFSRDEDAFVIVHFPPQSSDFQLLDDSNFRHMTEDDFGRLADLRFQRHERLVGEQLMLSALGGWMRVQSQFFFPPLGNLIQKMIGHELDPPDRELFSLQDWSQVVVMGRDQYVRVIQRGYLFPFGHRVNQISIAERQFAPARDGDGTAAYLVRRTYLAIQEPERTYDTRDMPLRSVKIANLLTPDLDDASTSDSFIPMVNGRPFAFQISATDTRGATTDIAVPMVFVPATMPDLVGVGEKYQTISRVDFRGQAVAFVPGSSPNGVRCSIRGRQILQWTRRRATS